MFLARRDVYWRQQAALRLVEMLGDRDRRSYAVLTAPPGAGKSSLASDLAIWLICGGGLGPDGRGDPALGRSVRIMIGSAIMKTAIHSAARIAAILANPRPFLDRESQQRAERSLVQSFGRFVPTPEEPGVWQSAKGRSSSPSSAPPT